MLSFSEFRKITFPLFLAEAKGVKKSGLEKTRAAYEVMVKRPGSFEPKVTKPMLKKLEKVQASKTKIKPSRRKRMNGYDDVEMLDPEEERKKLANIGVDELAEYRQIICAVKKICRVVERLDLDGDVDETCDMFDRHLSNYSKIVFDFSQTPTPGDRCAKTFWLMPKLFVNNQNASNEIEEKLMMDLAQHDRGVFRELIRAKNELEDELQIFENNLRRYFPDVNEQYERIKFNEGEGCANYSHWEMVRDNSAEIEDNFYHMMNGTF